MTASTDPVHRAPMRSRCDDIDQGEAVAWALAHDVVGVGECQATPAVTGEEERIRARIERFEQMADGAFVWTMTPPTGHRLGRVEGPARRDDGPGAHQHDLVVVRPCRWIDQPIEVADVPPGVLETFERGGRNFQRIHADGVEEQTRELWERLGP